MSIALEGLQEDGYQIDDLQALRYNRTQSPFFDEWLAHFYDLCRESQILNAVFGGNPPSTFEAIVSYLASKPLVVMGRWVEERVEDPDGGEFVTNKFVEAGFAFPIITCGVQKPELAAFCGFGFLKHVWGKPELPVLGMLGLAYMFQEWGFKAIHGTRFTDNLLASRFMRQFGMRDIGQIPDYQLRDGVLVPAVVSTLARADFEKYVENYLVEKYRSSLHAAPVDTPEPPPEPEKPKESPQMSLGWMYKV